MRTNVLRLEAQWPIGEAKNLFERNEISGAPVVQGGQLVGVLSLGDILRRHAATSNPSELKVAELMTAPAVVIRSDASLREVAEKMLELRIRRLPVVDEGGGLVGIITAQVLLESYLKALNA